MSKLKLYWGGWRLLCKLPLTGRKPRDLLKDRNLLTTRKRSVYIWLNRWLLISCLFPWKNRFDTVCVNLHIFLYWVRVWSQNSRPEESSDDSDHLLCKVLFSFPVDAMKMLPCPKGAFLKSLKLSWLCWWRWVTIQIECGYQWPQGPWLHHFKPHVLHMSRLDIDRIDTHGRPRPWLRACFLSFLYLWIFPKTRQPVNYSL